MPWYTTLFATLEKAGGKPRLLFTFARANEIWRLTNSTVPLTAGVSGLVYTPALIHRGRYERAAEVRATSITIQVARTSAIADALREVRMYPMRVRIERMQVGDTTHRPMVEADGDVANVRLNGGWVECELVTAEQKFSQPFPTKIVSRQCQWATFSADSGLNEDDWAFSTTITDITRNVVTVAGLGTHDVIVFDEEDVPSTVSEPVPLGWYDGGQIKLGTDPAAERLFVRFHNGTGGLDFHILGRLPESVTVGDTVLLIPGDDRSLATWRDKFGATEQWSTAVDRFLGFDLLPATDPLQEPLSG